LPLEIALRDCKATSRTKSRESFGFLGANAISGTESWKCFAFLRANCKLKNAKWKKYKKEIILYFAFYNFHFAMPSACRQAESEAYPDSTKRGGLTG